MDWDEIGTYIAQFPKNNTHDIYIDDNQEKPIKTVNEVLTFSSVHMSENDLLFLVHAWIENKRTQYNEMKMYIRVAPEITNDTNKTPTNTKSKNVYCRIQFAEVNI